MQRTAGFLALSLLACGAIAAAAYFSGLVTSTHTTSDPNQNGQNAKYTYRYDDTSGNPFPSRVTVAGTVYTESTVCPPANNNEWCWEQDGPWVIVHFKPTPTTSSTPIVIETSRRQGSPTPGVTEAEPAWSN